MKILFVSSGNKNKGKPGILVANQGASLQENNISVNYFVIKGGGIIGYLKAIPALKKEIRRSPPDLIHSHYSLSAFTTTITLALYGMKIPHVVSLMGSDSKIGGWKRKLTKRFAKKRWNRTIVKAKSMAEELQLTSYDVVPNGVKLSDFTTKETSNSSLVLFPADPDRPSKNFKLANEAIRLATEKNKDIHLKIVFGVDHQTMIHELQQASCILVTSLWEGSPNIVKESMAANKPVVCTRVGDAEWLLDNVDGCYLVDHKADSVAEGILNALRFGRERGESTNGRQKLKELKLDSDNVAHRLIQIYESTCKKEQLS